VDVEDTMSDGYPIILNGDHAEFEAEWASKDPKLRPDWPLPSFDALDWAEAFCKRYPSIDADIMVGWFANALMRGFDERTARMTSDERTRDNPPPDIKPPTPRAA
jgi:hypothetical protein